MTKKLFVYPGEAADVSWDGELCIHLGECGKSDGALFEGGRTPWCQPDLAAPSETLGVVERCATGALSFKSHDGALHEEPDPENVVVVSNNGPLYVRGNLQVDGAREDQPGLKFRAALCRCGQSKNKPFCDGAHEAAGFIDRGAVGKTGDGSVPEAGLLVVKRAKDGPLMFGGSFAIVSSSGRVAWTGKKAALCRCGQSKNKPFCDGSHGSAGFQAE